MGALADVKHEWQCFRHDEPGARFKNHRERMQHRSRKHSVVAVGIGVLLLVGGGVLLFMPGPGLLLIVFGLALVASHSKRLSAVLDRSEPKLRAAGRHVKRRWNEIPARAKLGIILGIAMGASAGLLFMWEFVIAAYLIG